MPNFVRSIFLQFLPTILMMKRPERIPIFNGYFVEEYCAEEIFDASKFFCSVTANTGELFWVWSCHPSRRPSFHSPIWAVNKSSKGPEIIIISKWAIPRKREIERRQERINGCFRSERRAKMALANGRISGGGTWNRKSEFLWALRRAVYSPGSTRLRPIRSHPPPMGTWIPKWMPLKEATKRGCRTNWKPPWIPLHSSRNTWKKKWASKK